MFSPSRFSEWQFELPKLCTNVWNCVLITRTYFPIDCLIGFDVFDLFYMNCSVLIGALENCEDDFLQTFGFEVIWKYFFEQLTPGYQCIKKIFKNLEEHYFYVKT